MQFYVHDWKDTAGCRYEAEAEELDPKFGDAPRCPVCGKFIDSVVWLPPYRVDFKVHGKGLGDLVHLRSDLIVSDNFRRSFERAGLTGLEFHQVEIRKTTPTRLAPSEPFYYTPVARGRAAIDVTKSEFDRGPVECSECRSMVDVERIARIVFEDNTWDGLDIFTARGLGGSRKIVSERFKEVCEREHIIGFKLRPAEEYSFDSMPWRKDWPKT